MELPSMRHLGQITLGWNSGPIDFNGILPVSFTNPWMNGFSPSKHEFYCVLQASYTFNFVKRVMP